MSQLKVILRFAISLDGYLNDRSAERLLLSNAEDFKLVDRLRSESDAILVGAETIRADNPGLKIRSEEFLKNFQKRTGKKNITRLTCTNSGVLPINAKFFNEDQIEKLVFCSPSATAKLSALNLTEADIIPLEKDFLPQLVHTLCERNYQQLLVEGGASLITQFLNLRLADQLIISVAPRLLGVLGQPHFIQPNLLTQSQGLSFNLLTSKAVGEMVLLHYQCIKNEVPPEV